MPRKATKRNEPRINMTFYDDNLEFLRHIAWVNHMSITQYVNQLVGKDKAKYDSSLWKKPETADKS